MPPTFVLLYGAAGYAVFLATFLYLIGFVTGIAVPVSVDAGGAAAPVGLAIAVDVALVALFGVQHSVMARPWFKRRLERVLPAPMERTTFMLATCAVFAVLFLAWRPLPQVIWSVPGVLGDALLAVGFAGWGLVLLSTFLIDHFDLFGLRQTWLAFRGRAYRPRPFQERSLYRHVRHPLMLGFLIAFWAAPTMTAGRLVLAAAFTLYIVLAVIVEERDLVAVHGGAYRRYQRRVPKFLPLRWSRPAPEAITAEQP
jgi:protein-S-isoprenylcysteine O-methyltransferase Ste14